MIYCSILPITDYTAQRAILRYNDHVGIRRGRVATRLYVVSIAIIMYIMIIYLWYSAQTITQTIQSPYLEQYEALQMQYPDVLQCPCATIPILHKEFVQITPIYHQICSSNFRQPWWYKSLRFRNTATGWLRFLQNSKSYFLTWDLFCEMATVIMTAANSRFSSIAFVNTRVLSSFEFSSQINATIVNFLSNTLGEFLHKNSLVGDVLHGDAYVSGLGTNIYYTFNNITADYEPMTSTYKAYSFANTYRDENGNPVNCVRYYQVTSNPDEPEERYSVTGTVDGFTMV